MHSPRELLGTVGLVQHIVSQSLQVREMCPTATLDRPLRTIHAIEIVPEQRAPQSAEIGVLGIVNLYYSPRVNTAADVDTIDFNFLLGAHNGKGHHGLA